MARRTRRSTEEVRRLIMEAAADVFSRKGYEMTTTDDIAIEAGVARSVMFRHFATKADLFRAAVLQPFMDLLTTFKASLEAELDELWDEERLMRTVVEIVYDSFRGHRTGILAMATLQGVDDAANREAQGVLNDAFAEVAKLSVAENERRGWPPQRNLELSIRIVMGMIASMSVLDGLFVPQGRRRPSRNQLIEQLTQVALHGVQAETGPPVTVLGR
jgi:AcrR family transcriptional regulator